MNYKQDLEHALQIIKDVNHSLDVLAVNHKKAAEADQVGP